MRRMIEFVQTYSLATRHEALVLIWLSCLLCVGTLGNAFIPESSSHKHVAPQAVLSLIDSSSRPTLDTTARTAQIATTHKPPVDGAARIDVNKATARELENIPGVGEATAQRIIELRRKRRITAVEDLLDIKGIGKKKLEKMRPYIIAP